MRLNDKSAHVAWIFSVTDCFIPCAAASHRAGCPYACVRGRIECALQCTRSYIMLSSGISFTDKLAVNTHTVSACMVLWGHLNWDTVTIGLTIMFISEKPLLLVTWRWRELFHIKHARPRSINVKIQSVYLVLLYMSLFRGKQRIKCGPPPDRFSCVQSGSRLRWS